MVHVASYHVPRQCRYKWNHKLINIYQTQFAYRFFSSSILIQICKACAAINGITILKKYTPNLVWS